MITTENSSSTTNDSTFDLTSILITMASLITTSMIIAYVFYFHKKEHKNYLQRIERLKDNQQQPTFASTLATRLKLNLNQYDVNDCLDLCNYLEKIILLTIPTTQENLTKHRGAVIELLVNTMLLNPYFFWIKSELFCRRSIGYYKWPISHTEAFICPIIPDLNSILCPGAPKLKPLTTFPLLRASSAFETDLEISRNVNKESIRLYTQYFLTIRFTDDDLTKLNTIVDGKEWLMRFVLVVMEEVGTTFKRLVDINGLIQKLSAIR